MRLPAQIFMSGLILTNGLFVLAGCSPEDESAPFSNIQWFTDRGNLAQTATVNDSLSLPLFTRWSAQLSDQPIVAPVAGGHSLLFVGVGTELYALSPTDGTVQWQFATQASLRKSATVVSKDKGEAASVYLTDDLSNLYSLDAATGALNWTVEDQGSWASAPSYASGVIFYVASVVEGRALKAVSAETGTVLWQVSLPTLRPESTPLLGAHKVIVGADPDTTAVLRVFHPQDGSLLWSYSSAESAPGVLYATGVIDYDVELGEPIKVITGVSSLQTARLVALELENGAELWSTLLPSTETYNTDVIGYALTQERPQNYLVVTQLDQLYGVDKSTGEILWQQPVSPGNINQIRDPQRPTIWGDFVFMVHNEAFNSRLVAYALEDGSEVWSRTFNEYLSSNPIIGDRTLYLGTATGKLYALSPSQ